MLDILFLGDVVGRPGRRAVGRYLRSLRGTARPDFIIANGENAAGGKGLDPGSAEELRDEGVDVITTGNHVWQVRDLLPYLDETDRILRPCNFPRGNPGRGWVVHPARGSRREIGVVNVIGRVFMGPAACPFEAAREAVRQIRARTPVVVVDMHGEATSEKVAMGRFLDGSVSAVIGSHTHVQTADEEILPGGTAFLTDAGMCGPSDSILGMRVDRVLDRFVTQMPTRFEVATGSTMVQGVRVGVDEESGRAVHVTRVRECVGT